jgi:hypothetical protein
MASRGIHCDGKYLIGTIIKAGPPKWIIKWDNGGIGKFESMKHFDLVTPMIEVDIVLQDDPNIFIAGPRWNKDGGCLWLSRQAWEAVIRALDAQSEEPSILNNHLLESLSMLLDASKET